MLQKNATIDDPGIDALCAIGTVANIVRHITSADGLRHAVCHGIERFRIEELVEGYPFLAARIQRVDESELVSTQADIVQNLRKASARNCVMMLDEVDKMSASLHGDPSAALLEVLDPEQNSTFRDNYLGVPFDLSRVVFIATANVIDNVPPPVRDRMEIIDLPGYTREEKLQIALRHLVQRQREANGLKEDQCDITVEALNGIIENYTREAGVRQLERKIGRVMRHAAMQIADNAQPQVLVDAANLDAILGSAKFEHEIGLRTSLPGVATGLAWTPVGGDILFIEATRVSGGGRLILTGQLGDVMKESAQAALTLVKARAGDLGIPASTFDGIDVHVHVPAGAIPRAMIETCV